MTQNIEQEKKTLNFIEQIVEDDLNNGLNNGKIQTRFPPEPNGYLHIGHAKAICLDFGIAQKYNGTCNLRFDDTNPVKEDVEYVEAIKEDIQWLGFEWENVYYASDYFQKLFDLAIEFIKQGKAYVDEQTSEQIAGQKGTPTVAGTDSPFRNRPVEENLQLFEQMSDGEITDGKMVLRAKINMAHPNMHFRDPIMYRIITTHPHHRTGYDWKVYPMYDFAHGQSDYFEGVTHSICTLEFEVHRPLYDWYIDQFATSGYRPKQREFNRLNITYTMMSKRKLLQLVQENLVSGWDDPRMPTLCGLRRRGYTPEAIRNFIDRIGYTKFEAMIDVSLLEASIRENLNATAKRVSAVLNPVKLVIENYPENQIEQLTAENNPENPNDTRQIEFSRNIYIERDDFMENPQKGYFRLFSGGEVRLKNAYIIKCTSCKKDENGEIQEIYCTYDPNTRSGMPEANRKVKGTLHWVSAHDAIDAEVRVYDRLFNVENPSEMECDFRELLNTDSKRLLTNCKLEPCLKDVKPLERFQFQRLGYFCVDYDSTANHLIFNRTVSLKDSWKK
ncbi:MAG: glutamine--tRNA ligase/YqeY domain fusion protein [Prevotellaceae bacterium]|jgi:glutaminyl-tRNA synthetase|nr:glutamine--tRNA ligase/YqeY domain fusion protein [Prevotellaceae bacterium]